MPTCPHCQQIIVTRDGHDRHRRQRFTCGGCGRDFTIRSASAFSGYRWPTDVILMAVRWYLRHPLSATSVMELLAERGIDVSNRTVLRWVQTFGPQLAAEARKHRLPLGRSWYADEMFFFRGKDKWHLYRAVDEHGQVVDVLLSVHRDTTSAEAFFAQALGRSGQAPSAIIALPGRLRVSARPAWRAHPFGRPVACILRLGQPARSRANRGRRRARAGHALEQNASFTSVVEPAGGRALGGRRTEAATGSYRRTQHPTTSQTPVEATRSSCRSRSNVRTAMHRAVAQRAGLLLETVGPLYGQVALKSVR